MWIELQVKEEMEKVIEDTIKAVIVKDQAVLKTIVNATRWVKYVVVGYLYI